MVNSCINSCLVRVIQQQLRRIEGKLDNPCTGLAEIKDEVSNVEGIVEAIKCMLKDLDLEDLEEAIAGIADAVGDIEYKLDSPEYGLAEIKDEVREIELLLKNLDLQDLLRILLRVEDEVERIEAKLDSPVFGLSKIKQEVAAIENKLDSPAFGLAEIKSEIVDILDILRHMPPADVASVTSGPMFLANQAKSAIVQALNYSNVAQAVTFRVYDVSPGSVRTEVPGSPFAVLVPAGQSSAKAFNVQGLIAYEVVIEAGNPKVLRYWSGSRTQPASDNLAATTLVPENIVLHADFVPLPQL